MSERAIVSLERMPCFAHALRTPGGTRSFPEEVPPPLSSACSTLGRHCAATSGPGEARLNLLAGLASALRFKVLANEGVEKGIIPSCVADVQTIIVCHDVAHRNRLRKLQTE